MIIFNMNASQSNDSKGSLKVLSLQRRDTTEFEYVSVDYFPGE